MYKNSLSLHYVFNITSLRNQQNNTHMRLIATLAMGLALAVGMPSAAYAKKKKKAIDLSALKKDSVSDYKKLVKGATVSKGLFNVYFNKKTGKVYFEIPQDAFKRTYMLSSRISSISDTRDYVAGQMHVNPILVKLSSDERNVYMHQIQHINTIDKNDPIAPAFERNNLDPVLKGFKIMATKDKSVFIDVTAFFGANEKCISPIKTASPIAKLLGNGGGIKGTFQPTASGVSEVKAFEKNIEIKSLLSFMTTGVIEKPYSVNMHRSFFVLPENPMAIRLQDNKVGYFYDNKSIYSSNADRIEEKNYINRWRLEPKPEDREKYFNGELVEPMQPIVFYVDSAFPEKWRNTIKEGIEVWNVAFEKAGFKNAIIAKDYPKNDSIFDPDDMRYSCFRYVGTNTPNAMGPSYTDPRTGEILSADVIWYHNILSLLHNWRFVQTGAVDPRVRKAKFDDEVMNEAIKYAASHEIGHTLGLMHNMGASYSFPVEKLRDPAFTQKYGTTPSIMDYARNNFVAQPGDVERGVKLTPPDLGVYDIYAIEWGYRLIKNANTPDAEKPVLDSWIAKHEGDPMYEFGAQQVLGIVDPTDQTEDLGNDHILASNYGISNLKILLNNLEQWTLEKGERYDEVEKTYMEVTKQYGRYVKHVMPYLGGIRYEEIRQGDGKASGKHYIGKDYQKKAMLWLVDQARTYDSWLTPRKLIDKLEVNMDGNNKLRSQIVAGLINGTVLYRIKDGGEADPKKNYVIDDYLNDVTNAIFTAPKAGKLTEADKDMQSAAIAQMIKNLGLEAPAAAKKTSLDEYAEFCEEYAAHDMPCSHHISDGTNSFARINLGVSSLSKDEFGAIMMGRLQAVAQKYKTFRNTAKGTTKNFYDYQILKIERALKK